MRTCLLATAVIALCIMSGASFGEDASKNTPAPSGNSANTSQDNQDEMICRRVKLTGTLLPGPRVCKSRKIWEQEQQNSKDVLDDATRHGLQSGSPNG
jgi:hypothetical protein